MVDVECSCVSKQVKRDTDDKQWLRIGHHTSEHMSMHTLFLGKWSVHGNSLNFQRAATATSISLFFLYSLPPTHKMVSSLILRISPRSNWLTPPLGPTKNKKAYSSPRSQHNQTPLKTVRDRCLPTSQCLRLSNPEDDGDPYWRLRNRTLRFLTRPRRPHHDGTAHRKPLAGTQIQPSKRLRNDGRALRRDTTPSLLALR